MPNYYKYDKVVSCMVAAFYEELHGKAPFTIVGVFSEDSDFCVVAIGSIFAQAFEATGTFYVTMKLVDFLKQKYFGELHLQNVKRANVNKVKTSSVTIDKIKTRTLTLYNETLDKKKRLLMYDFNKLLDEIYNEYYKVKK